MIFSNVLEYASELTLEEQESFVEILQKRIHEEKRKKFIQDVKESEIEYSTGNRKTSSIEDILAEITNDL